MKISSNTRVKLDKALDWLPVISTVNNLIDLWQKHAYKKAQDPQDPYHQRIIHKKRWKMGLLSIPVIGQIFYAIYKFTKEKKETSIPPISAPQVPNKSKNEKEPLSSPPISAPKVSNKPKSEEEPSPEEKYKLALSELQDLQNPKAFRLMNEAAEEGCIDAQITLGYWYHPSYPLNPYAAQHALRDTDISMEFFQKAADQNNSLAQCELGLIYRHILKDGVNAEKYLKLSADQNFPKGQFELGRFYKDQSKASDDEFAVKCFPLFEAAEHGKYKEALIYLGECYFFGAGTEKDLEIAKECYEEYLESPNPDINSIQWAQNRIGEINRALILADDAP